MELGRNNVNTFYCNNDAYTKIYFQKRFTVMISNTVFIILPQNLNLRLKDLKQNQCLC